MSVESTVQPTAVTPRMLGAELRDQVAYRQRAFVERRIRQLQERYGHLPRREVDRPLPDFLIIGAAKAGTTSLFDALQQHPQIATALVKEPDFFTYNEVFEQGNTWYRSLFQDVSSGQLLGDASTSYSRLPLHPEVAPRAFAANPLAKIIYVTRDPVHRTYSHMIHRWQREIFPGRDFNIDPIEYLLADPVPLCSSLYEQQLAPWRQLFGNDQVHIVSLEELHERPTETLGQLCRFLGIVPLQDMELARSNDSKEYHAHALSRDAMRALKQTLVGRVAARVVPHSCRKLFYQYVARPWGQHRAQYGPAWPALDDRLQQFIAQELAERHLSDFA